MNIYIYIYKRVVKMERQKTQNMKIRDGCMKIMSTKITSLLWVKGDIIKCVFRFYVCVQDMRKRHARNARNARHVRVTAVDMSQLFCHP